VGMVGRILRVVDAGERKGGESDSLGRIDDGWRYVRQGFEIRGGAGGLGLGVSPDAKSGGSEKRERDESTESSH
jgi:hypothetical protein